MSKSKNNLPEKTIDTIISTNNILLIMTGFAMSIMYEMRSRVPLGEFEGRLQENFKWYEQAVENVVYKNIAPPRLP